MGPNTYEPDETAPSSENITQNIESEYYDNQIHLLRKWVIWLPQQSEHLNSAH